MSRKTIAATSFLPSSSAYTRSAAKPGNKSSEHVDVDMQEAVLTCKAEELDQFKGVIYVDANPTATERQVSEARSQWK